MSPIILLLTLGALYGAYLVSRGDPLTANVVFLIINPALAYHNFNIGELEQALLFIGFSIIAVYGVYNLGRAGSPGPESYTTLRDLKRIRAGSRGKQ